MVDAVAARLFHINMLKVDVLFHLVGAALGIKVQDIENIIEIELVQFCTEGPVRRLDEIAAKRNEIVKKLLKMQRPRK